VNACFQEDDLAEYSQQALQSFDERVARLPKDLCAPFHEEARVLETELLSLYRVVVLCTKREDDLAKVSAWWGRMVSVCDEFAQRLGALHKTHPYCGAEYYYDRVFDLRNKCQRLQKMHA